MPEDSIRRTACHTILSGVTLLVYRNRFQITDFVRDTKIPNLVQFMYKGDFSKINFANGAIVGTADCQMEQFCVHFKFYLSLSSFHDKYTVIITSKPSPLNGRHVTKLLNVIAETLRSSGNTTYVGPALLGLIDP